MQLPDIWQAYSSSRCINKIKRFLSAFTICRAVARNRSAVPNFRLGAKFAPLHVTEKLHEARPNAPVSRVSSTGLHESANPFESDDHIE